MKKMPQPILITGAARSGTSLVTGCINICGAFGGSMSGPTKYNQKGMFENHKIRQEVHKPYFKSIGADPLGQFPLPNPNKITIPTDFKKRIEDVIISQGYKGGHWFYKGAKACLVWPLWHYAFPNAKWVIVRRRTGDIANSCIKTSFMRAFRKQDVQRKIGVKNERDGWIWWVNQHLERFREMMDEGLNCSVIWPERFVYGDYQQLFDLIDWLGLKWNSEVFNFIDPKLWHARNK
jgi:hypothetical protein